jgi:hypothetical protein
MASYDGTATGPGALSATYNTTALGQLAPGPAGARAVTAAVYLVQYTVPRAPPSAGPPSEQPAGPDRPDLKLDLDVSLGEPGSWGIPPRRAPRAASVQVSRYR